MNVSVRSQADRVVVGDAEALDAWLSTVRSLDAFNVTTSVREALVGAAEGLSLSVPHIEASVLNDHVVGAFDKLVIEARVLPSGYLGLAFWWALVSYRPLWSSPFWEAWEADPTTELKQINSRLAELLLNLPNVARPPCLSRRRPSRPTTCRPSSSPRCGACAGRRRCSGDASLRASGSP